MTSEDYSQHIKELHPNVIMDSKQNKRLQCPKCFFKTAEKEAFIDHKQTHLVNDTTEKKGGKDRAIKNNMSDEPHATSIKLDGLFFRERGNII